MVYSFVLKTIRTTTDFCCLRATRTVTRGGHVSGEACGITIEYSDMFHHFTISLLRYPFSFLTHSSTKHNTWNVVGIQFTITY